MHNTSHRSAKSHCAHGFVHLLLALHGRLVRHCRGLGSKLCQGRRLKAWRRDATQTHWHTKVYTGARKSHTHTNINKYKQRRKQTHIYIYIFQLYQTQKTKTTTTTTNCPTRDDSVAQKWNQKARALNNLPTLARPPLKKRTHMPRPSGVWMPLHIASTEQGGPCKVPWFVSPRQGTCKKDQPNCDDKVGSN